jgi:hypothetical protein
VIVALFIFPIAIFALWSGYKLHRYLQMLVLGVVGLALMAVGLGVGLRDNTQLEQILMISAGIFLVAAHAFNLRACRITIVQGQPLRRHDHSSGATVNHKEPGISTPENA